jgi:protocatechuate 3,4-dioxygenase beta subunit
MLLAGAALAGVVGWVLGRAADPTEDAAVLRAGSEDASMLLLAGRDAPAATPELVDASRASPDAGVPPSPPEDLPRRLVEGLVVDGEGNPVEGIPIVAAEPRKTNNTFEAPPDAPFAWSGPDGRFAGWVPAAESELGVGRVEGWTRPQPVWLSSVAAPVLFVVRRAVTLAGTVLDASGRPVEGAIVWVFLDDSELEAGLLAVGVDGRFTFPVRADVRRVRLVGMPPLPRVAGAMEAEAVVELPSQAASRGTTKEIVLRFDPGTYIAGRVLGPDGEPVGGITLGVHRIDGRQRQFQGATSDAEGAFRIEALAPGAYWLSVAFTPPAGYAQPNPIRVDAPATGVGVRLRRAHDLRGRILGENAGDFVVTWSWGRTPGYPGALVKGAKSKPDGSFEIAGVPDGDSELLVRRSGDDRCALLRRVDPTEEVLVRLERGHAIAGRVSLPSGQRWQEIAVSLRGLGAWIVEPIREDGSFRITGLPAGAYRLGFQIGGARGEFPLKAPVEAGTTDVHLVLPEALR